METAGCEQYRYLSYSKLLLNIFWCGLSNQYKTIETEMEYTESVQFAVRRIKVLKYQGIPGDQKNTSFDSNECKLYHKL